MRVIAATLAGALALSAGSGSGAAAAAGAPSGGATTGVRATGVRILAAEYSFDGIVASGIASGRIALAFTAERPTPGYRVAVESVRLDPESRAIVARVVETPPEGMVAQVITRSPLTIGLPALAPGTYAFRLDRRRGSAGAFSPAVAVTLEVSGPVP